MEPMAVAGGFATVVGLLADFVSTRGQNDVIETREFVEWLRVHGHGELIDRIERNTAVTVSIKAALAEGKSELLTRLHAIEALLVALSVDHGALHSLALALNPVAGFSPQAAAILGAYESAGAGRALLLANLEDEMLLFLDGSSSSSYKPTEHRFFQADLRALVEQQMLSLDHNGRGERLYQLTRRGAAVATEMTRLTAS